MISRPRQRVRIPVRLLLIALCAGCGGGSGGPTGQPELAISDGLGADATAGPLDPAAPALLVFHLRGRPLAPWLLVAAGAAVAEGSVSETPTIWAGAEVALVDTGAEGFEDQVVAEGFLDQLGEREIALAYPAELPVPAGATSFEIAFQLGTVQHPASFGLLDLSAPITLTFAAPR